MSQETTLSGGGEIFLLDLIKGIKNKYEIFCLLPKDGPLTQELKKNRMFRDFL